MGFVRPEALKNHGWKMASHSQPSFAKHFNFRYVAALINKGTCKIRRRMSSAQPNFSSIKRTLSKIRASKICTGCVTER